MNITPIAGNNRQALAGTVNCGICKNPMLRVGPNYTCTAVPSQGTDRCPGNTIDADGLLELVIDRVMGLVMTEETVDDIVAMIQGESADAARRQQRQLDQTELALAELNSRKENLGRSAEPKSQEPDELNEVTNASIALQHEARLSRRELDALDAASNRGRLRANAVDLRNYRHPKYPEYTGRIVRMFIESVEVSPGAATLNFKLPIPTEREPEGALADVLPLC